jgi:hypothetical protein
MNRTFHRLSEPRNRVIGIYIGLTLLLTAVSLLFWLTGFSARHSFLLRFIFFDPGLPGTDLTLNVRLLSWRQAGALAFNPPGVISPFNYCPFAIFLIVLFLSTPAHPVWFLIAFVALCVLIAAFCFGKRLIHSPLALAALITAVCTSFPFAFLFERGNIEGLVWIPTAAGVYCFVRKNYLASALLIGVAASIKPFPGMLLLLLLPKRRYKEFVLGIVSIFVIAAVSLAIIGPTFMVALKENIRGFNVITERYVLVYNSSALGGDHSLFSMIKPMIRAAAGWPRQGELLNALIRSAYPYYVALAALIFVVSIFFLRKLPVLNQIFGLCVLTILISPANYDYTLIVMYIPWSLLLLELSRPACRVSFPLASVLMTCCAILFTSQFYLLFGLSTFLAAPLKTLALCSILFVSVAYPLPAEVYSGPRNSDQGIS